jgi:hypothetical protein
MSATPLVTHEDRQRGWAELEIEFTDGSRESVRVHILEPADVIPLASLSSSDALRAGLAKSLRVDAAYVARIRVDYQFAIMALQVVLMDGRAKRKLEAATDSVFAVQRSAVIETHEGHCLASFAEVVAAAQPVKEAMQGLMQNSRIPPLPKL